MPGPTTPTRAPTRVLVIPGLHDSGPGHWQSWLQSHHREAVRVQQDDWAQPDLHRWAERIGETIRRQPRARWVAVAHSFGCLALARHLGQCGAGVEAALLVAPANPDKFGVAPLLSSAPLGVPAVLVGSRTDPWMDLADARAWAERWRAHFIDLGDVGHINVDSGFGPWPQGKQLTQSLIHRVERAQRMDRAHASELSFAV